MLSSPEVFIMSMLPWTWSSVMNSISVLPSKVLPYLWSCLRACGSTGKLQLIRLSISGSKYCRRYIRTPYVLRKYFRTLYFRSTFRSTFVRKYGTLNPKINPLPDPKTMCGWNYVFGFPKTRGHRFATLQQGPRTLVRFRVTRTSVPSYT